MKALVIGRPKFQVPPDMAPMVTQGALDWYERYFEVDDTETLSQMIVEMPFATFSDISAELYVEGDKGFRQFQEAMQVMMAAAG
jgi:hypothetical protein